MNAQKRGAFNKVPDFLQALVQPHKPAQRIGLPKIQHVHSRGCCSRPARYSDVSRLVPRCCLRRLGCANHTNRRCQDDLC